MLQAQGRYCLVLRSDTSYTFHRTIVHQSRHKITQFNWSQKCTLTVADLHSKILDAWSSHHSVQFSLFSCSFWAKFGHKIGWCPSSGKSWIHHCTDIAFLCLSFSGNILMYINYVQRFAEVLVVEKYYVQRSEQFALPGDLPQRCIHTLPMLNTFRRGNRNQGHTDIWKSLQYPDY